MANVNVTSDAWTEISITSGTVQNISATADIELSAEQTDNSGVVLKPSEIYQWDNETIYARAVTESAGALRVVNFKKAAGGGGGYVLPVATDSKLGGVKVGGGLDIDASGVLSAPVTYSTTEQQIGTWIDGKPLYQLTISDTMPETSTQGSRATKNINVDSLSIQNCVNLSGWFLHETGIAFINSIINYADDTAYFFEAQIVKSDSSKTNIDILHIGNSAIWASNSQVFVTIQYTKTTD